MVSPYYFIHKQIDNNSLSNNFIVDINQLYRVYKSISDFPPNIIVFKQRISFPVDSHQRPCQDSNVSSIFRHESNCKRGLK